MSRAARTRWGAGVLCAAVALGVTGCASSPDGPPVVVLFPGSADDDWGASAAIVRDELADDGYAVDVHFSGDDIPLQLHQLRRALAGDPTAVVLAPVDVTAVAAELAAANAPDVAVISYDRLAVDAPEIDYFATFDHTLAGRMQAQSLLDALGVAQVAPLEPFMIELLAGSGDDPAAQAAFSGAIDVLEPHLASGALVVPSERIEIEQAAILRGSPDVAADRVRALLDAGHELDAVLSPTDAMSAAVARVLTDAGYVIAGAAVDPDPAATTEPEPEPEVAPPHAVVLTGGGSTSDGAAAIREGAQTSSTFEDPRRLAFAVAAMVREVVRGSEPHVTRGALTDNGARQVPTLLLEPQLLD